jgi:hypothetical protein
MLLLCTKTPLSQASAAKAAKASGEAFVDPFPSESEDEEEALARARAPLPFERGDFCKSYGCEHGGAPPPLPLSAPPIALFDWREKEDAALLLGEVELIGQKRKRRRLINSFQNNMML